MVTDTLIIQKAIVEPAKRISTKELERRTVALRAMSGSELRSEYRRLFGIECYSHNYAVLRSRCEWKLYTMCHGELAPEVIKYACTLSNLSMLRERRPAGTHHRTKNFTIGKLHGRPKAATDERKQMPSAEASRGSEIRADETMTVSAFMSVPGRSLKKTFRGTEHTVHSMSGGRMLYKGEEYKSLSAVAKEIAAYKCSGNVFFRDATLIAQ